MPLLDAIPSGPDSHRSDPGHTTGLGTPAVADSTTLKAVVFDDVKPLYQKTDSGYEGLGVDVLEQIRMQARRRKVD